MAPVRSHPVIWLNVKPWCLESRTELLMDSIAPNRVMTTKLYRPLVRTDLFPRPRLIEQLNRGLDQPLTLICAGAGFGKTTLAVTWIEQYVALKSAAAIPRSAWLSLDERDSDLRLFLRYFISAVQTVVPEALKETAELTHHQVLPSAEAIISTFSNDLARLPYKIIVVLDDFHVIRSPEVHALLGELLQHWPSPLHLVIVSRHWPPLPLSDLRAKGKITEIRNKDLRFTPNEAAAYLHQALPTPLRQQDVELIEERTEGWIAGLLLTSLSLRDADSPQAFLETLSGANVEIAEYLTDEVLSRQPQAVQTFLLQSSILTRFCAALCEAVAASEDPAWNSHALIEWLVRSNLLIIQLDNRNEWYRYHPLFRELLQYRLLASMGPVNVADLHRKAAGWFAQRGMLDDCIYHALAADDSELTAQFMERALPAVLNRDDRIILDRWLRLLSEEFIQNRPGLLLIKAWSLHFSWQLDAVTKVIQAVEVLISQRPESLPSREEEQLVYGQIAAMKCQQAYYAGEPARSITYGWEALAQLPRTWTYVRGGTMLYIGMSMQAIGEGDAAQQMLLEDYESLLNKTDGYALRVLFAICMNCLQAGQLEEAERTATVMLRQATQSDLTVIQGWGHFILGLVYYQWNNLDGAQQHFETLVAKRYQVHSLTARSGAAGLALVHIARLRKAEAWRVVELMTQFDLECKGRLDDVTQSVHARVLITNGKVEQAGRWADSLIPSEDQMGLQLLELPQLTKVRVLLTRRRQADLVQAQQILDDLYAVAEDKHNLRRKIEILALSALVLDALGKLSGAKAALQEAIAAAKAGGFVRTFVDLGPRMAALLTESTGRNSTTEFVQRTLAAFPSKESGERNLEYVDKSGRSHPIGDIPPTGRGLVEPLTARETQLLRLLREPLNAKEIAIRLDISYATMKRHSINLYSKLGVNSRWDAVAKAETLQLLTPR